MNVNITFINWQRHKLIAEIAI